MPALFEPVLISLLTHWVYCPRRAGLVQLEAVWEENVFTVRGTGLHKRVDEPISRTERGRRAERALPLWSDRHGLYGKADLVEFLRDGTPVPVETKSGKASERIPERVQLCAQALCLEEMFGRAVPEGAVFYASSQKRVAVEFDDALREETLATVAAVRTMTAAFILPPARYDRRCRNCSLLDACLPQGLSQAALVRPKDLFKPFKEADLP
ncbi:CRISPR-associated protein Cas4 [bacterium]|nr:MAG: CRISPR-associated protein Cas4 [bacterium]